MKIYSTFSSEKATKSQGGNEKLSFEITVGDPDEDDTRVILYGIVEREETETEDIYRLWDGDVQVTTVRIPKKGKKQKDENKCKKGYAICLHDGMNRCMD